MKYLFGLITTTLIVWSFMSPKCTHMYVPLEKSYLKAKPLYEGGTIIYPEQWYNQPKGVHDGKELVCIKCFHQTIQKIDYGQPFSNAYVDSFVIDPMDTTPELTKKMIHGGMFRQKIDTYSIDYHRFIGPRSWIDSMVTDYLKSKK